MEFSDCFDNSTQCESSDYEISPMKLSMCVIFSIIFIIGIIGNSLVIYVIARFKEMHVVTNIYLLSQAIADFLYLTQIPFLISHLIASTWIFGYFLCKFYMFAASVIWFAGLFSLTAVSVDRYVAVVHFRTQARYRTKMLAIWTVIGLWIFSLIVMTPIIIASNVIEKNDIAICMNDWPQWFSPKFFTAYTFFLGYFIPVILIVIFYSLVIRTLHTSGPDNKNKTKQQKVTTLVLVVVLTYIILWLPYWTNQVSIMFFTFSDIPMNGTNFTEFSPPLNDSRPEKLERNSGNQYRLLISYVCQILSCINSALNPILYAFMSQNFRACFKTVCRCSERVALPGFENSTMTTARTRIAVDKTLPTYEPVGTFQEVSPVTCEEHEKFVIVHLAQGNGVESPEPTHEKMACVQETDID